MINILEKLLGFTERTILYSPIFGKCMLMSVNEYTETITVTPLVYPTKQYTFSPFGQFMVGEICCGECLLFPSREQRNWDNFASEKYIK